MLNHSIEEKINQEIEKLKSVADSLPGVIIIHDLRDWSVAWMSDKGLKELNITLEEITSLSAEAYYSRFFNEEDSKDYVPKILGLLESNQVDEALTLFQQVRFSENANWLWHVSSTKILLRNDEGKPLLIITISFPIDAMHYMAAKAARLLEEKNFLRNNLHTFSKLSKREIEVLKLLALGKTSGDTADALFISVNTVETHRKNIKQKLNTNSYYELCQYARAFDLI